MNQRLAIVQCVAGLVSLAALSLSFAEPLDNWEPLPRGNPLVSVTYATSNFVAVGKFGAIWSSADGARWSRQNSGTDANLNGIAWGNGLLVAAGSGGTILTSGDGIAWTKQNSGTFENLTAVGYGNGLFVAVGDSSTILTSTNGITWRPQNAGVPGNPRLFCVTYGNGTFVIGGDSTILFSRDVQEWSHQPLSLRFPQSIRSITFGNSIFMAVGVGTALTSTNGITWAEQQSPSPTALSCVTFGRGTFVAGGAYGSLYFSTNGLAWGLGAWPNPVHFLSIAWGNGVFVAIGSTGLVLTSQNGMDWTSPDLGVRSNFFLDIAYGNGTYVAVGYQGDEYSPPGPAAIATLANGALWTNQVLTNYGVLHGVAYNNGTFVAVGGAGTILTSPDGLQWTARDSGTTNVLSDIVCGNHLFVAVGGAILTSADGVNWANQNSQNSYAAAVAYGNGRFVAVGRPDVFLRSSVYSWGTNVLTSLDGTNWVRHDWTNSEYLNAITFAEGKFVALGHSGSGWGDWRTRSATYVVTTSDGATWDGGWSAGVFFGSAIAYGNGVYAAVGSFPGYIATSLNGTRATTRYVSLANFNGVAFAADTFVAVGSTILQSGVLSVPPLSARERFGEGVELTLPSEPGRSYRLQYSTNLLDWIDLAAFTARQTATRFVEPFTTNFPQRFYRALTP